MGEVQLAIAPYDERFLVDQDSVSPDLDTLISHIPYRPGHTRGVPSHKRAYLESIRRNGSARLARKNAGISANAVRMWQEDDALFCEALELAKDESVEIMVDEARRRAIQGVDQVIFWQGAPVGTKTEYSDRLLEFLLKGELPQKYRDNKSIEHHGAVAFLGLAEGAIKDQEAFDQKLLEEG